MELNVETSCAGQILLDICVLDENINIYNETDIGGTSGGEDDVLDIMCNIQSIYCTTNSLIINEL